MREFFCLRAFFIVYRDACMLIKIADVRCLKRLINALYHICRNVSLSIFFLSLTISSNVKLRRIL